MGPAEKYEEVLQAQFDDMRPDMSLDDTLKLLSTDKPNGALYAEISKDDTPVVQAKSADITPTTAPAAPASTDTATAPTDDDDDSATVMMGKPPVPTQALPLDAMLSGKTQRLKITVE